MPRPKASFLRSAPPAPGVGGPPAPSPSRACCPRRESARHGLALGILILLGWTAVQAQEPGAGQDHQAQRNRALKLKMDGNFKEAYEGFRKLLLDPQSDSDKSGEDLQQAVEALRNLGRVPEQDGAVEESLKAHPQNWRVLFAAAQTYHQAQHYGYQVGNDFHRGHHRGGGTYVNSFARDRARALQLIQQGLPLVAKADPNAGGWPTRFQFYYEGAAMVLGQGGQDAWQLQNLTDLKQLPDLETGWSGRGGGRGAPVDAEGNPILHRLPKSFEAAGSDGERWRWLLMLAGECAPAHAAQIQYEFAAFLRAQFDVQTLAGYRGLFRIQDEDQPQEQKEGNPYAVRTLGENETLARLASGIKRFPLPDEFNFIRILRQIPPTGGYGTQAHNLLGQIFEDRLQYEKSAEQYAAARNERKVQQIRGAWGAFEDCDPKPANEGALLEYRYRNGKKAVFEAWEINVPKLIDDVKAYLRSKPARPDWRRQDISNIGYRLVQENQTQYLGAQAAAWTLDLEPRPGHYDRRIPVQSGLKKAGAYLVTAKIEGGNTTRIVLWLNDTVLTKKNLHDQTLLYLADAVSGKPVAGATLDLFGFRTEYKNNNQYQTECVERTQTSNSDGIALFKFADLAHSYQWLITARSAEGRFAWHGYTGIWHSNYQDQFYDQRKVFLITDRPAYRPKQEVRFKFWITQAKYDREGPSPFAGQSFPVRILNPKGEKCLEKSFTADSYGGFDGTLTLPEDATLGQYSILAEGWGGGSFRVEEYKKPEFEVKIEAPSEPVMLGDKITATVKAKYYFGAPVVEAKVKYKVLRSAHTARWYPRGRWDWFFEPGYWWFASDYDWYPGWKNWGCGRPGPWWWRPPQPPPEVVAENEVQIAPDGTVKIEIDTALAKALQGDTDHRYQINAEVVDQSRRTIAGSGEVLVARKPFQVYAWVDRGYYQAGDTVAADFAARTLDGKPVKGKAEVKLFQVGYDPQGKPAETEVQKWALETDAEGQAKLQLKAAKTGQFRLSCTVTDEAKHALEGAYLFTIRGEKFDGADYRFNDLELLPDRREYQPGETARFMINADRAGATILLFTRPANGVYLEPKILHLQGKSTLAELEIAPKDMPNFFVEAVTIAGGRIHTQVREIAVPPASRILNVELQPAAREFKPGEKAKLKLVLTEQNGEPYQGSAVVTVYDKALEYIAGGSNVPEIKSFFWKWRRNHYPRTESSLDRRSSPLGKQNEIQMQFLGVFGALVADMNREKEAQEERSGAANLRKSGEGGGYGGARDGFAAPRAAAAPGAPAMEAADRPASGRMAEKAKADRDESGPQGDPGGADEAATLVQAQVRTNFADSAFWAAALETGKNGSAEIELPMPENLTTWKIKVWAMGGGARVGQGETEVLTTKNLLVRLQAPRFFTQKDEVVLSANIHNYLKEPKKVQATLELDGPCLAPLGSGAESAAGSQGTPAPTAAGPRFRLPREVLVEAGGEARVDWRVLVAAPGEAKVRMLALSNQESDAMEMTFPAQVHGMLKTESYAGLLRPEATEGALRFKIPQERRVEQTRLEARYSPTLAGALVDALPYLASYPYGCTEQTLNRFLPTVITQNVLLRMNLDLKAIRDKRTNLNAQELGSGAQAAARWKRYDHNPVFDQAEVKAMVKAGIDRLAGMQVGDGGWGWFSGWGEQSYPHTTAYVVHGLQVAKANDAQIPPAMIQRGVQWLRNHQQEQLQQLKNAASKQRPYKEHADDLDAFVYMVLADAASENAEMRETLYRDRNHLAVYSKAIFGLALHTLGKAEQRDMLLRNVEQYLVKDAENQTAYLNLPAENAWWCWYGSEYEAQAYYLKLLAATQPKGETASWLVKYLLNNRRHASYWNSTRDTAVCIEALADYLKSSGEDRPDLELELLLDGKPVKQIPINAQNLFSFDNALVLEGGALAAGEHTLGFRKKGTGPLYFNAYVSNFTLEDRIAKAGLEVKVERRYYRLRPAAKTVKAEGQRGQALDQKVEKYVREPLDQLATLKSGELVEVELEIESKNDYEYLIFEDMKPAGFEPVEVRSGYAPGGTGAYVEYRDNRVAFFVRALARGKHGLQYRMRAEIPGRFSALPTRAWAMYAPELKANSDEIKLQVTD